MNNRMIEDFAHRYDARIKFQRIDNAYGYNRTASYFSDSREFSVDIELSQRAFEHIVEMDHHAELDYRAKREEREEQRIRDKSTAVAKAWEQYKMLLELCR